MEINLFYFLLICLLLVKKKRILFNSFKKIEMRNKLRTRQKMAIKITKGYQYTERACRCFAIKHKMPNSVNLIHLKPCVPLNATSPKIV